MLVILLKININIIRSRNFLPFGSTWIIHPQFRWWVPCCSFFYSFLLCFSVGGLMSYLRYWCLLAYSSVQHILTVWVTCWVSYKKQELLTIRRNLGSPTVYGGSVLHIFSFLCRGFSCLCLSFVLCAQCCQFLWIASSWLPLRFSLTFNSKIEKKKIWKTVAKSIPIKHIYMTAHFHGLVQLWRG
jgi:hypothetical protein